MTDTRREHITMSRNDLYMQYLEALVASLLNERNKSDDIVGIDWNGKPATYSPYNAKQLINQTRTAGKLPIFFPETPFEYTGA